MAVEPINVVDFVASLTDWLATRSALTGTSPRQLWGHSIEDTVASSDIPMSRLTRYGGQQLATAPVRHALVQCYTRCKSSAKAMLQAERLRAAMCDSEGMPACEESIVGYRIKSVANATVPGLLGRDGEGCAEVVFNFEVNYIPAA